MALFYGKDSFAHNKHWVQKQILKKTTHTKKPPNTMLRETIRNDLTFIEQQMAIKSIKARLPC